MTSHDIQIFGSKNLRGSTQFLSISRAFTARLKQLSKQFQQNGARGVSHIVPIGEEELDFFEKKLASLILDDGGIDPKKWFKFSSDLQGGGRGQEILIVSILEVCQGDSLLLW
jgi:hypothetical protein